MLPPNLYFFHKKSILKEYWYINKSTSQQHQYHLWLITITLIAVRGGSLMWRWFRVWSGVGRGGCGVWRLWRHIRPVGRTSNKLLEAGLSGEVLKMIYSQCGQKNSLWQNLPGRMTFWCSSQQIGRAVGQGAFPLLPRYPLSEQAVSHFCYLVLILVWWITIGDIAKFEIALCADAWKILLSLKGLDSFDSSLSLVTFTFTLSNSKLNIKEDLAHLERTWLLWFITFTPLLQQTQLLTQSNFSTM